jgi:acyl-CoA thioesterase
MKPAPPTFSIDIPHLRTLGINLVEIGERYAVMSVVVDEQHGNYLGGAHGGLIASLVDTVCFFPKPLLPSGRLAATTSLTINYIKAAQIGEQLLARAELLHLGRRTASLSVQVTGRSGKLIAHGCATLTVLKEPHAD